MSFLVFDVGGTHLRSALAQGERLLHGDKRRIASVANGARPAQVWRELVAAIGGFAEARRRDLAAGAPVVVSFPGPVDRSGRILDAPTLVGPQPDLPDFRRDLEVHLGRPVHLLNDLSAAAWHLSLEVEQDRFLVVTVSSGIGSKVFDRRHPLGVLDDQPYGGEIGHVTVDASAGAPLCDCGGRGHLGAIASGRGIERLARREARRDPGAFRRSACAERLQADPDSLSNEIHLVPAARLGDAWSLQVIRRGCRPLAQVLLAVTAACGLEKVLLIGGFALSLGPVYLRLLRQAVEELCDYRLLAGELDGLLTLGHGDAEACLRGAAVYGCRRLGEAA